MKKILGIIGAGVFALTLFMNAAILFGNESSFTSLASASISEIDDGGGNYKWRTMTCDNGNSYQFCSIYGEGEKCSPHTKQIGDCDTGGGNQ